MKITDNRKENKKQLTFGQLKAGDVYIRKDAGESGAIRIKGREVGRFNNFNFSEGVTSDCSCDDTPVIKLDAELIIHGEA